MFVCSIFRCRHTYRGISALGRLLLALTAVCFCATLHAQQTGDITGKVSDAVSGEALAGVTIKASSPVLPSGRSTSSGEKGDYRLALLPPGQYMLVFTLSDGTTRTRVTNVLLQQRTVVDLAVTFGMDEAMLEEVVVVASTPLTDTGGANLNAAVSSDVFNAVPVGQEYRDLIKLIPGVQYTQDQIRGPSAGGNGQDNVYQFDGVDVTLPLFGTLSAEPSTHDIDQVAIIKGGAKAIGFNRSGGFTINTISKSGTDEFHGEVSYQIQPASFEEDRIEVSARDYEEDKDWISANFSGPIIEEKLLFYLSYYRPTVQYANSSNVYGEIPDYKSIRDEYFGKLTWAPTEDLLFDASYRSSDKEEDHGSIGAYGHPSTSAGRTNTMDIGILEGSWIISADSNAWFRMTDFENKTRLGPDILLDLRIHEGDSLDIDNLDRMGNFFVPRPIEGEDAYNAFIQPLIDHYGYLKDGVPAGGGNVGAESTFSDSDFFRRAFETGYDLSIEGDSISHDLHFGYKWEKVEEVISRTSNGWGDIIVPGGRFQTDDGIPIYFRASFQQMSLYGAEGVLVPPIHSEAVMQSIEINDTIHLGDWTFNIGVMMSKDEWFGRDLKPNPRNLSGFELAPGHQYKMKEISWDEMIAPRLGVKWDITGTTSTFLSFAKYYPAASSLPRSASWARNNRKTIRAYFDENGNFIEVDEVSAGTGKYFQKGIDPRYVDEYTLGANFEFTDELTGRAHVRYRGAGNFWEDTPNNARVLYEPPPGIQRELYVPDLDLYREEIGGASYVIAQLDRAHTDYWELSFEGEYQGDRYYLRASYVWSDYTGNFDQDNTATNNDNNIFIGSSYLADGPGRQLWDFREGTLKGNRKHQLKIYGYYKFNWNGNVGAYLVYQSGQPWEVWSAEPYRHLPGSSSSSFQRFAEPAGSRTSDDHWQLDLNYAQDFRFGSDSRYSIQLRVDLFNVFDNQTGYNIQSRHDRAGFAEPMSYFNPRRFQLTAKFRF